ncbi:hypothetical protein ZOSMA_94G00220 [Zostera marina]|uniref:Uncharacterized protein n=1 Tax=Zostera marina TaxID=29655 RepID=A0A0K9NIN8_ZOSMR|nr:hypothetical protein ZOSMA_94G00220 [Zostera marina]
MFLFSDSVFVEFDGDIGLSAQINEFQNRSIKSENPMLCKIPNNFRANHEKEYEPEIIAIGPYHRNGGHLRQINSRLKYMEDMKLKFLIDLCKATANNNEDMTKEDVLKKITIAVQSKVSIAQMKYSESSFNMSSEDFVKMLILDGSFIVQLFIKRKETPYLEVPILKFIQNGHNSLDRDLILFENQIPFFILETIFGNCFSSLSEYSTLLDLALLFLCKHTITFQMLPNEYWREENPKRIDHLLHLSYICIVGRLSNEPENHVDETLLRNLFTKFINAMTSIPNILKLLLFLVIWPFLKCCTTHETPRMLSYKIPNATRLNEYGIKFQMKKIRCTDIFLDVSFKDGIMEIPYLIIENNTISKFRNLLALEQSCEKYGKKFTRYISFMNDLIDKDSDVVLLTNKNIIDNFLGSTKSLANMFIEMCEGLTFDPNNHYLIEMYKEINMHCNRPVNKWWAKLMHRYFNSPWSMISLFGVFFLLTFAHMDSRRGSRGRGRVQNINGSRERGRSRFPMPTMDFPPIMVSPLTFDCRDYIGSPNRCVPHRRSRYPVDGRNSKRLFLVIVSFEEFTMSIVLLQKSLTFRLRLWRSFHSEYQFPYKLWKVTHTRHSPTVEMSDSFDPSTIQCNQLGNVPKGKYDEENESSLRELNIDEVVRKVVEEYVPRVVVEVTNQEDVILSDVVVDSVETFETIVPVMVEGEIPLEGVPEDGEVGSDVVSEVCETIVLDVVEEEVPEDMIMSDAVEIASTLESSEFRRLSANVVIVSDSPVTKSRSKGMAEKRPLHSRKFEIIRSHSQLKKAKTVSDSKITQFYHFACLIQYRCRIATYMTAMKDAVFEKSVSERILGTPFGHFFQLEDL